jgi:hypothetical protein
MHAAMISPPSAGVTSNTANAAAAASLDARRSRTATSSVDIVGRTLSNSLTAAFSDSQSRALLVCFNCPSSGSRAPSREISSARPYFPVLQVSVSEISGLSPVKGRKIPCKFSHVAARKQREKPTFAGTCQRHPPPIPANSAENSLLFPIWGPETGRYRTAPTTSLLPTQGERGGSKCGPGGNRCQPSSRVKP